MIIGYPMPCQTLTMITAGIAQVELDSHCGPSIPSWLSRPLITPLSGWKNQNQTNPIATTFVTYGAKYAVRKNATPRIGRAHSSARTRPMPIVSGMLARVK